MLNPINFQECPGFYLFTINRKINLTVFIKLTLHIAHTAVRKLSFYTKQNVKNNSCVVPPVMNELSNSPKMKLVMK